MPAARRTCQPMSLKIGLTGGVACGKSTVARLFGELGVQVIDADKIVHELYRKGEPVYDELVRRFGKEILDAGGEIDRRRLAALAFEGGRVQELNKVVHPAVFVRQQQWLQEIAARQPKAIAMVEAALILEAGGKARYDKIIVVTCRPEQKIARYAERAGIAESQARAEVERRSKAQWSDAEKAAQADYVIDNSGAIELTRRQVERIYTELRAVAASPAQGR
jgi:dephospho-CoA kinase